MKEKTKIVQMVGVVTLAVITAMVYVVPEVTKTIMSAEDK